MTIRFIHDKKGVKKIAELVLETLNKIRFIHAPSQHAMKKNMYMIGNNNESWAYNS